MGKVRTEAINRNWIKALATISAFLVLFLVGLIYSSASANAAQHRCNFILSGLWAGANFDVNKNYCDPKRFNETQTEENLFSTRQWPVKTPTTQHSDYLPKSPSQIVSSQRLYVGLGDSVAAGAGLSSTYINEPASGCVVSSESYVSIVANELQIPYINAACSGATARNLLFTQRIPNNQTPQPAQIDAAFSYGAPELITISAGANDARWVEYLQKCYRARCGTRFDNLLMRNLRNSLQTKLQNAMQDINYRTSDTSPPQVILVGYYMPISQSCSVRFPEVTPEEITWMRSQVNELNNTIKSVADQYAFASFAPVNFDGRDICSANPLMQGLNDPAPFHPTAEGQRVIAQSVLGQIR
jgi:lysophospholipase L1-like esterase